AVDATVEPRSNTAACTETAKSTETAQPTASQKMEDAQQQEPTGFKREKRYNFRFSGGEILKNKLQRAKEVLSHKFPEGKLEQLLEAALDELLEKHAPELQAPPRRAVKQHNVEGSY